mmetsp:Transcript_35640/g.52284  ORF Transcript_35640/g.52284 Transcript_35640/m.52284 type:complete len:80 (-) Transcript_35640:136-375(-)
MQSSQALFVSFIHSGPMLFCNRNPLSSFFAINKNYCLSDGNGERHFIIGMMINNWRGNMVDFFNFVTFEIGQLVSGTKI